MTRFTDRHYYDFGFRPAELGSVSVKCPECRGLAEVTADKARANLRCTCCHLTKSIERMSYRYVTHHICPDCERRNRVEVIDKKQQTCGTLNIACKYCGYIAPAKVSKQEADTTYDCICDGKDSFFGQELYFLTYLKDKKIWAINKAHLEYLINYVEANLREKPLENFVIKKTQSDHLPTFIKTAKNRSRILKQLKALKM